VNKDWATDAIFPTENFCGVEKVNIYDASGSGLGAKSYASISDDGTTKTFIINPSAYTGDFSSTTWTVERFLDGDYSSVKNTGSLTLNWE
jgi:hypothetical protein